MLFPSFALLALASYVSADALSDALAQYSNINPSDVSAQLAWLSDIATISGHASLQNADAFDSAYEIPSTLDSEQSSLLNAIIAGDASGSEAATAIASLTSDVSAAETAMESMDMNSSEMAAMSTATGSSASKSKAASSSKGSSSASKSKTASSSKGSSSASGFAGKEGPMFIGAALAGLSVLLL